MYQPMLSLHWKQAKVALIPFMVASFALPLISVQGLGGTGATDDPSAFAYQALAGIQGWLPVFPVLAALVGLTLGLTAWNWDHQLNHVYALSLPVPRWQYASLKMGGGVLLTVLPTLSFWVGSHVAVAAIDLPAGLHAYPNALALRFFLASLVTYSVTFAMAAGTVRTTGVLVTAVLLVILLAGSLNDVIHNLVPSLADVNVVEAAVKTLLDRNGPLEVFSGSWMLIDV